MYGFSAESPETTAVGPDRHPLFARHQKNAWVPEHPQSYFPSHTHSSSSDSGSKKPSGRTIFPLRTSGCRLPKDLQATSRATGFPLRAITISSPACCLHLVLPASCCDPQDQQCLCPFNNVSVLPKRLFAYDVTQTALIWNKSINKSAI